MSDIGAFVREMNQNWAEGRFEDLARYFDEQVVMLLPGTGKAMVGVGPMVESYREFCAMAHVHGFEIDEVVTFPFGDAVMCHAHFTVDYEIPSGRFQEEGMEIYLVDTSGPAPRILWRTQSAIAAEGSGAASER